MLDQVGVAGGSFLVAKMYHCWARSCIGLSFLLSPNETSTGLIRACCSDPNGPRLLGTPLRPSAPSAGLVCLLGLSEGDSRSSSSFSGEPGVCTSASSRMVVSVLLDPGELVPLSGRIRSRSFSSSTIGTLFCLGGLSSTTDGILLLSGTLLFLQGDQGGSLCPAVVGLVVSYCLSCTPGWLVCAAGYCQGAGLSMSGAWLS